MAKSYEFRRPLSDRELLELIEDDKFFDDLPLDNSPDTDVESDGENDDDNNNRGKNCFLRLFM